MSLEIYRNNLEYLRVIFRRTGSPLLFGDRFPVTNVVRMAFAVTVALVTVDKRPI